MSPRWIVLLPGVLGLALLQTSAAPAFDLFGVGPNLLLVTLCCWAVVRREQEALILVPLAGLWIGLLSVQGLALSMAAFAPVVLFAALRKQLALRSEFAWALTVVVAATIAHFLVLAVSLEVEGATIDWRAASVDVLLPSVLANALLALPLYWLVRLPTPRLAAARGAAL